MQPFSVHFTPAARAGDLIADRRLLALIEFGKAGGEGESDPRRMTVRLPQLGPAPLIEIWESATPVESGVRDRVSFARNDQVLFGHLAVDEREYANLEEATRHAYASFLPFAPSMGFPHYLRIWNYVPDIVAEENGVERYKSFCAGRHAGLEQAGLPTRRLPAASGVGSPPGEMLIYFLAARDAGSQLENPRQVSAFRYPAQYGPKSPAFSRAMVKDWGAGKHLYISGTASIVGHESQHHDCVLSQLKESLHNISTLIFSAKSEHGVGIQTLAELSQIKVYVRDERDQETIHEHIRAHLGDDVAVIYLGGDLCRKNLLVEVEALYAG